MGSLFYNAEYNILRIQRTVL